MKWHHHGSFPCPVLSHPDLCNAQCHGVGAWAWVLKRCSTINRSQFKDTPPPRCGILHRQGLEIWWNNPLGTCWCYCSPGTCPPAPSPGRSSTISQVQGPACWRIQLALASCRCMCSSFDQLLVEPWGHLVTACCMWCFTCPVWLLDRIQLCCLISELLSCRTTWTNFPQMMKSERWLFTGVWSYLPLYSCWEWFVKH